MIFAFVSLCAGTVGVLPKHHLKRLFWNFSQKQSKRPVNSSLAGDFRFSYLLIRYADSSEPQFSMRNMGEILKTGIPSAVQGAVFCFANIFVQASVNGFGETAFFS